MRVAVIGMGQMGRAMAMRLVDAGHEVTVWNRTASRATPVLHHGATAAVTPADAAARADDAVLVSLADDDAVLEVVLGPNGVGSGLGPSATVVDLSTVSPETSRQEAAAIPGPRFLAAPIAGGPSQLEAGEVMLLVGGPSAALERLRPLLDDLAQSILYCGEDPGAAAALKVLNNYLLLGGLALLAEVVAVAQTVGEDDRVLTEYLRSSPLVPAGLANRLDDVLHGDHEGWFSLKLGAKDLGLAVALAAGAGLHLPVLETVEAMYREAAGGPEADGDIAAVVESVRPHRAD